MPNEQWTIDIHRSVLQVLAPLPAGLADGVRNTIAGLPSNQQAENHRAIEGLADTYEVAVGFFRVVYQIQAEKQRIKVAMVNLRIE
ncbi:MAG: hypothetical protein R2932_28640 [Caldilineaceae bacterium]